MNEYFSLLERYFPLLCKGVWMTIQVLLGSVIISTALGSLVGIFLCNKMRIFFLSSFLEGCMFVLRAIPFFVWLLLIYFVLPDLLSCSIHSFTASIIALGLCSSGYMAQIIRLGLNTIPTSQWEIAGVLGYSMPRTLYHIIIPQMTRNILPAFTNELDSLAKSTATVSSIGLLELTRAGMNIVSRELNPVPVYMTIAAFYLCLSALINIGMKKLERKYSYA